MSARAKIIVSDKVYVPANDIDLEDVEKRYARRLYSEGDCRKCDNRSERHNYLCDECPAYQGHLVLHKTRMFGSKQYVGIPLGDRAELKKLFDIDVRDYRIVDKRVSNDFDYKVKTTLKPRPHQKKSIRKWVERGYGMLKAPPRSGKCVDGSTLLHTEFGTIRIESLFDGIPFDGNEQLLERKFQVLGDSGANETSHIYRKLVKSTFALRTHNGLTIRGIGKHPVLVLTPDLELFWKNLEDIDRGDYICVARKHGMFTDNLFSIEDVSVGHHNEVQHSYPRTMTDDLARVLGYLTANGDFYRNTISFTSNNLDVQSEYVRSFEQLFGITPELRQQEDKADNFRVSSSFTMRVLADFGLTQDTAASKAVPSSVLHSNRQTQIAFLEAYFNCDSHITKDGSIELCSASRELMRQVQVMLLNFGVVSRRFSKESYARNSESAQVRTYYYLAIGGLDAERFHATFKLVKDVPQTNHVRSINDYVPYVGDAVRAVYEKHRVGGTVLDVKGERKFNYRLFHTASMDKCRKSYLGYNMFNDLHIENIEALDMELSTTIELLAKKGYYFDPVTSVAEIKQPSIVYDVTVPNAHHYIGNGIVSHNTPTMLMISVKSGKRTLMLANQKEFLDQFLKHVEDFTNLPALQEKTGKRLFGYIKKEKDLEDLQIAVSPYQQFMSEKGKELWKKVRKEFGFLWVDEGHKGNAKEFARVLNTSTARFRGAVTATDKRKDGRQYIMQQIIGPVVSKIKVPQMQAKIIIHDLDFVKTRSAYKGKGGWSYCMRFLANHEKRNKFMLELLAKDLEAGHNIVLPLYTKEHIFLITRLINSIHGKGTAESFTGDKGCDRDAILDRARSGKTRVVVGVRSLLQLGLNVPAWTCLYYFMPMNNEPNWYQESSRILTPEEGKRTPVIRMFVDSEVKLVLGCWANTYKQTLKFKHKPTDKAAERASALFKKLGGRHEAYDPDELDDGDMTPVRAKLSQPKMPGLFRRR